MEERMNRILPGLLTLFTAMFLLACGQTAQTDAANNATDASVAKELADAAADPTGVPAPATVSPCANCPNKGTEACANCPHARDGVDCANCPHKGTEACASCPNKPNTAGEPACPHAKQNTEGAGCPGMAAAAENKDEVKPVPDDLQVVGNSICPVSGKNVAGAANAPTFYSDWKSYRIGFMCPVCKGTFDGSDDSGKDALLKKALESVGKALPAAL
jgi:hypothetical protein